jgi:peptidoglycan/LPS O-acetylase OafA/YrhL
MSYSDVLLACLSLGISFIVAARLAKYLSQDNDSLPDNNRFLALDGLRGYLALAVLAHHFIIWINIQRFGHQWVAPDVYFFNNIGAGAVALFFMATGFLFYPLAEQGFSAVSWPSFFLKRVFRIMPLTLFSILVCFAILTWRNMTWPNLGELFKIFEWMLGNQVMVFGDKISTQVNASVLWSIRYEWYFYFLLLPMFAIIRDLLRWRFPTISRPNLPTLIILLVSITLFKTALTGTNWAHFLLFALGMLVRAVYPNQLIARMIRTRVFTGITIVALFLALNFVPRPSGLAIVAYLMFFAGVVFEGPLFHLLRHKNAVFLGDRSFGIYLFHGIVLSLLFTEFSVYVSALSLPVLFFCMPFVTVITVLISDWLHKWVERPAILAGARMAVSIKRQ